MTLRDAMSRDASVVFLSTADFAEPVVYTKTTGAQRSINAIVSRDQWGTVPGTDTEAPLFDVHVANSTTLGISSDEIAIGKDKISFAVRIGQPPTSRTIQRIVSHDEGMLVLECR